MNIETLATPRPRPIGDATVRIERVFDAPRALVFDAWTEPHLLARWFAPRGCTLEVKRLDVRVGGGFHLCIHKPGFGGCWTVGTYTELIRPELIVFTLAVADAAGRSASAVSQGHNPEWPDETIVRVTFAERDGQTVMTLEQTVSEALARQTGAYAGWSEMLDRLEEQLRSRS